MYRNDFDMDLEGVGMLKKVRMVNIRENRVLISKIGFGLMKYSLELLKNVNIWINLTNMLRDRRP